MSSQNVKVRTAALTGIVAASLFTGTPIASAADTGVQSDSDPIQVQNWQSYLAGARVDFQSRRWSDEAYSEVRMRNCDTSRTDPGPNESVSIDLRWDRSLEPDKSWGVKKFTNCFDGKEKVSAGEWTGLSSGSHFFQIDKINDSTYCCSMSAEVVYVDTTKAD